MKYIKAIYNYFFPKKYTGWAKLTPKDTKLFFVKNGQIQKRTLSTSFDFDDFMLTTFKFYTNHTYDGFLRYNHKFIVPTQQEIDLWCLENL